MKGLTLLELFVVMIIITILASIASPMYLRVVSRSRESEGWLFLATIRSAEMRYYTQNEEVFTTDPTKLDLDVTSTPLFNYAITVGAPPTFTATANPKAACSRCRKLCLDNAGTKNQDSGCP